MDYYQRWIRREKAWMGHCCRRRRRVFVRFVFPAIVAGTALLLALFPLFNGGGREDILPGALGGLFMGLVLSGCFLLLLELRLRPGDYLDALRKSTAALPSEALEQLCRELLEPACTLEFTLPPARKTAEKNALFLSFSAPKSRKADGKLVLTSHYVLWADSSPCVRLVPLEEGGSIRREKDCALALGDTIFPFPEESLREQALALFEQCGVPTTERNTL